MWWILGTVIIFILFLWIRKRDNLKLMAKNITIYEHILVNGYPDRMRDEHIRFLTAGTINARHFIRSGKISPTDIQQSCLKSRSLFEFVIRMETLILAKLLECEQLEVAEGVFKDKGDMIRAQIDATTKECRNGKRYKKHVKVVDKFMESPNFGELRKEIGIDN